MATTHKSTTVQPTNDGPDVLYCAETGDWSAFANGVYLDSFANSQAAWAAARSAAFTPVLIPAPVVTTTPSICEDENDPENDGKQIGLEYRVGEGVGLVEACDGDTDYSSYPWIDIFFNGFDGTHIEDIEAMLPNLIALISDPRIQAAKVAKAAYRATLPPQAIEEAMSRQVRLLHTWSKGYNEGSRKGQSSILGSLRTVMDRVKDIPDDDPMMTPMVAYSVGFAEGQIFAEDHIDLEATFRQMLATTRVSLNPPAVRIETQICDVTCDDERFGKPNGTMFIADNGAQPGTSDYIQLYIGDSYRPHNDPSMVFMGQSVEDLDAFCRLAPLALALLNSPEVQAARQRWADQMAAAAA